MHQLSAFSLVPAGFIGLVLFLSIGSVNAQQGGSGWVVKAANELSDAKQERAVDGDQTSPVVEQVSGENESDEKPLSAEGSSCSSSAEGSSLAEGSSSEELSDDSDTGIDSDLTPADDQSDITPPAISDRQLAKQLDQQFYTLNLALQNENVFSPIVGEHYFGYGTLLKQAGRFDEARDAFVDALHIEKVNNGIYAIEQRPTLKALFETYLAMGNAEDLEDSLKRVIWLEDQNPELRDNFSFDMVLKMGNYKLDRYLERPSSSEGALLLLESAKQYFAYALARYEDNPISELLMPYGELALTSFLEYQVYYSSTSNSLNSYDRGFRFGSRRPLSSAQLYDQPNRLGGRSTKIGLSGEFYLKRYLTKARIEENDEQIANALLGLGDINLMSGRIDLAQEYYRLAWQQAQTLADDSPIRLGLNQPVELPAFNYSMTRLPIKGRRETIAIPLTIDVAANGKVASVDKIALDDEYTDYYARAKRTVNKLIFRPAIIDGKLADVQQFTHQVKVHVKKKTS